jgi:hypothetical protein
MDINEGCKICKNFQEKMIHKDPMHITCPYCGRSVSVLCFGHENPQYSIRYDGEIEDLLEISKTKIISTFKDSIPDLAEKLDKLKRKKTTQIIIRVFFKGAILNLYALFKFDRMRLCVNDSNEFRHYIFNSDQSIKPIRIESLI